MCIYGCDNVGFQEFASSNDDLLVQHQNTFISFQIKLDFST